MDRIFGLDAQLLFDVAIMMVSIFILFTFLSYLLFEPARALLEKRKQGIASDLETASADKAEALKLKNEYDAKLKEIDKEAEHILSAARKKALLREDEIVNEAKAEAAKIIDRANHEITLEKKKVLDEMKQEMIKIASLMTEKFIVSKMDTATQDALIDETLKEMGDNTWLS